MKQYNSIKVKIPEPLLLLPRWDFYEDFWRRCPFKGFQISGALSSYHRKQGGGRQKLAGFSNTPFLKYLLLPKFWLKKAGARVCHLPIAEGNPKLIKTIV